MLTRLKARIPVPRRLRSGGMLAGAVAIAAGTGSAQLIGIAAQPILTRLYTPAEYGAFSVAIAILYVLGSVTNMRYEFAVALPRDEDEAANVLAASLVVNACLSVVSALLFLAFGPALLAMAGASLVASYAPLLAIGQLAMGLNNSLVTWAVRTKTYSMISLNRLIQAVVLSPVQVILGLLGLGAPGLLLGAVLSAFAGAGRLARAAWRTHAQSFRQVSGSGILRVLWRYRRFPIYSSPSAVVSALGIRAPVLLLVPLYGADVGGQYFLAERLLHLPLTLVASSVSQVFDGEGASLTRSGSRRELKRLFMRTTRILALIAVVPAALIALAAPLATGFVFGSEWEQAGLFITALMPMFYLTFVVTATGNVLALLERQPLHLVREAARLALLAGAVLVSAALNFSALWAVVTVSAAGCLAYTVYWVISWRVVRDGAEASTSIDEDVAHHAS